MNLGSNVMRKGCLVGLATVGHHSWQFTRDLIYETRPLNFMYSYQWIEGRPIEEAYNLLFHLAKEGRFEYLFLKEEDTIAPPESWMRMMNKMRYNPDLFAVTAVYPRKSGGDPTPFFYRGNLGGAYLNWKWGEFFEVTGIPFGCTLIRVADLEKMDPHVDEVDIQDWPGQGQITRVKRYAAMLVPLVTPDGEMYHLMSPDLYFSEKAQKAGLKLWVDASVRCSHLDLASKTEFFVPIEPHAGMIPITDGKTAVNIGCGSDLSYIKGIKPVRIDFREEVAPDIRMDIRGMDGIQSSFFDYVRCYQTLEHFSFEEARMVLKELARILKPGGELHLSVPDVVETIKKIEAGSVQPKSWYALYGRGDAPWNFHKSGYDVNLLNKWLGEEGLRGAAFSHDEGLGATLYYRAFKEPAPSWFDPWRVWGRDHGFNGPDTFYCDPGGVEPEPGPILPGDNPYLPEEYKAILEREAKKEEPTEEESDEGRVPDSGD